MALAYLPKLFSFLLALPYALFLHLLLLLSGVSLIFCVTVLTQHFSQSLLGFAPALKPWLPVLDNAHPCLKQLLVSGIPALLVTTGGSGMMRSLSLFSLPLPCSHYFSHSKEGQTFKQLKLVPFGWYRLPDRQSWRQAKSSQTSSFWRLIVMGIKSTLLTTCGIDLLSYPVHITETNKVLKYEIPFTVPEIFLFGVSDSRL